MFISSVRICCFFISSVRICCFFRTAATYGPLRICCLRMADDYCEACRNCVDWHANYVVAGPPDACVTPYRCTIFGQPLCMPCKAFNEQALLLDLEKQTSSPPEICMDAAWTIAVGKPIATRYVDEVVREVGTMFPHGQDWHSYTAYIRSIECARERVLGGEPCVSVTIKPQYARIVRWVNVSPPQSAQARHSPCWIPQHLCSPEQLRPKRFNYFDYGMYPTSRNSKLPSNPKLQCWVPAVNCVGDSCTDEDGTEYCDACCSKWETLMANRNYKKNLANHYHRFRDQFTNA